MEQNYAREEVYNPETIEKLSEHYRAILELLGEDTDREGLVKTPERIAKAMCFLTRGYDEDPREILLSAKFHEEYKQMVIVKDIEPVFALRTPHASFLREGARRIHSERLYYRTL